jgi:hypothetical protein
MVQTEVKGFRGPGTYTHLIDRKRVRARPWEGSRPKSLNSPARPYPNGDACLVERSFSPAQPGALGRLKVLVMYVLP